MRGWLIDGRVLHDQYRTRGILDDSFRRAAEQQASDASVAVRTDYNKIGLQFFSHLDYLFVRIPDAQNRLRLQSLGDHLLSDERELLVCFASRGLQ